MNKLLSISIAAYNAENFLDTALATITSDEVVDELQIIVVNDGSKDCTKEVAEAWQKKFPDSVIVINKENGGYGSTINSAIKVASGKYFKLLDADDCYDTRELLKLLNFLKTNESDLVITDYYKCQDSLDNRAVVKTLNLEYDSLQPVTILPTIDIMHALVVKTDILKKWKENYLISEHCFYTDLEYCTKAILSSKNFIYKDFKIYCYLIGREGQSVSLDGRVKHINDHERVVKLVSKELLIADEKMECRKMLYEIIRGHVLYYSLCVKPTRKNLKTFIAFRDFVVHEVPYPRKEYAPIKKYLKHPRIFYLPKCFFNRTMNSLRKLIKR